MSRDDQAKHTGSTENRASTSAYQESDVGSREGNELSALRFVNVLLYHRWIVVLTPLAVALVVAAATLFFPPTYTVTAAFTPESGGGQAQRLSGLASQFGIDVPRGQPGESPPFYAYLLRTRELLKATVTTEYNVSEVTGEGMGTDLVSLLDVEADQRSVAVAKSIERLRGLVSVSFNPETGVVELSVSTRSPALSQQVADRMIDLVNKFNLERRMSQASAERDFIESQLETARAELRTAEDSLETFLNQNRQYEGSPTLRFERQRLQRRVDLRQQVFSSLAQSYQQAKIDEVRNTPVVTVVERPERPARPDSRGLLLKVVLGLLVGGGLAVFWAFGREMLVTSREIAPDDYEEFERLKQETEDELRRGWRRATGGFG